MRRAGRNDDKLGIHFVDERLSARRFASMMRNLQNVCLEHARVLRFEIEQQFLDVTRSARRGLIALLSVGVASEKNPDAVDFNHDDYRSVVNFVGTVPLVGWGLSAV